MCALRHLNIWFCLTTRSRVVVRDKYLLRNNTGLTDVLGMFCIIPAHTALNHIWIFCKWAFATWTTQNLDKIKNINDTSLERHMDGFAEDAFFDELLGHETFRLTICFYNKFWRWCLIYSLRILSIHTIFVIIVTTILISIWLISSSLDCRVCLRCLRWFQIRSQHVERPLLTKISRKLILASLWTLTEAMYCN